MRFYTEEEMTEHDVRIVNAAAKVTLEVLKKDLISRYGTLSLSKEFNLLPSSYRTTTQATWAAAIAVIDYHLAELSK